MKFGFVLPRGDDHKKGAEKVRPFLLLLAEMLAGYLGPYGIEIAAFNSSFAFN